jgi:hypothetical protein
LRRSFEREETDSGKEEPGEDAFPAPVEQGQKEFVCKIFEQVAVGTGFNLAWTRDRSNDSWAAAGTKCGAAGRSGSRLRPRGFLARVVVYG